MHLRHSTGALRPLHFSADEIAADRNPELLQAACDAQATLDAANAVDAEATIDVATTKRIRDHYMKLYGAKFRTTFMDEWRASRGG